VSCQKHQTLPFSALVSPFSSAFERCFGARGRRKLQLTMLEFSGNFVPASVAPISLATAATEWPSGSGQGCLQWLVQPPLSTQSWRFIPLDVSACSWTAGHQITFISVSLRNTWLRLVLSTARSSRQTTNSRTFSFGFLLGNSDNTTECIVRQRRRRAHLHVEQQPGVSLGRAFGTRSLDGYRTGFTCRPSGQMETRLLAQVSPCAVSI
jgi:hypothetical protein